MEFRGKPLLPPRSRCRHRGRASLPGSQPDDAVGSSRATAELDSLLPARRESSSACSTWRGCCPACPRLAGCWLYPARSRRRPVIGGEALVTLRAPATLADLQPVQLDGVAHPEGTVRNRGPRARRGRPARRTGPGIGARLDASAVGLRPGRLCVPHQPAPVRQTSSARCRASTAARRPRRHRGLRGAGNRP